MTTNGNWGHCSHCKHFGSPAAAPLDGEEAACKQPELAKVQLRVFGTCGCKRFELRPGLPATIEWPRTGVAPVDEHAQPGGAWIARRGRTRSAEPKAPR